MGRLANLGLDAERARHVREEQLERRAVRLHAHGRGRRRAQGVPAMRSLVVVLIGLTLAMPVAAGAPIGQVLFALGRVEVERGGQLVPVARGTELQVGDTISTGPTGLAQLRFKDGAVMA